MVTAGSSPHEVRLAARARRFPGLTTGCVQANLALLPAAYAEDFVAFCRANAHGFLTYAADAMLVTDLRNDTLEHESGII